MAVNGDGCSFVVALVGSNGFCAGFPLPPSRNP